MGSLAGMDQLRDVKEKIMELSSCCNLEMGGDEFEVTGASKSKGAFMMPTLFLVKKAWRLITAEVEAFGAWHGNWL